MSGVDYLVVILYLAALLWIGWRCRGRSESAREYFLAGRRMGCFPIGLSVMVTSFSAINFLALPGEVFDYGLYVLASFPVFFLSAWLVAKFWMPFLLSREMVSLYEFLERRFDYKVRALASGLFLIWRFFWMATALYATARIMGVLTGVPLPAVILAGGVVATLYTAAGGIRAVMWTDVLQFFVLFGGILLGVVFALSGEGDALEIAFDGGKLRPFAPFDASWFSLDPTLRMTFWSALFGVSAAFLARYGADQMVVQRYFTAKNLSAARKGLWLNAFVSVLSLSLLVLFGLAVYVHSVRTGAISSHVSAIGLIARMIRDFPAGVTGVIAAALLAATMSSIDSGINSCSAAYLTDFHSRFFRRPLPGMVLSGCIGAAVTLLALLAIPLLAEANTLFMIVNRFINGLGSPLLTLVLLALIPGRFNAKGVFYGGIAGLAASLAISFGVKSLALQYYAVVNLAVTMLCCLLLSVFFDWKGRPGNFRS